MGRNASQIRIAKEGDVLAAPVGSPVPNTADEEFSAVWRALGHLTEDGVEITASKDTGEIPVWSSAAPGKYYVEGASFTLGYTLAQWNKDTTRHYFGVSWEGGKLVIPSNPNLDEMSLAVVWMDDAGYKNVVVVERGMVTDRESINVNRTTGTMTGVTFSSMDHEGRLATLLSNDPAMGDEQPVSPESPPSP